MMLRFNYVPTVHCIKISVCERTGPLDSSTPCTFLTKTTDILALGYAMMTLLATNGQKMYAAVCSFSKLLCFNLSADQLLFLFV